MLKHTIEENLQAAMKSSEREKTSTLRMLIAALHNKEIALRKKDIGLSDEEVLDVIRSEVKKRKDAAEEFTRGRREDLAAKERAETALLTAYLPPELSQEEVARIVTESIRAVGATSRNDFGAVMKEAAAVLKGRASGDRVAAQVRAQLTGDA